MILVIIFSFLFSKKTTCGCRFSSPTMWALGMGLRPLGAIFPTLCYVHWYDLTSAIVTKDTDLISHHLEPLEEESWSKIMDTEAHLEYGSCGYSLCHVGQVCETRSFVSGMRALDEQRSSCYSRTGSMCLWVLLNTIPVPSSRTPYSLCLEAHGHIYSLFNFRHSRFFSWEPFLVY